MTVEQAKNNVAEFNKSTEQKENELILSLIKEYTGIAKDMIESNSKKGKTETTVIIYYCSPFDFKNEYGNPSRKIAEEVIYRVANTIKLDRFRTSVFENPALFMFGLDIKW